MAIFSSSDFMFQQMYFEVRSNTRKHNQTTKIDKQTVTAFSDQSERKHAICINSYGNLSLGKISQKTYKYFNKHYVHACNQLWKCVFHV